MPRFSISSYAVRVKEKYKRGRRYSSLDNFDEGHDFYQTFGDFLSRFTASTSHDPTTRNLMKVATVRRPPQSRILEGIIRTGEYGYEAELLDVGSGDTSYRRKTSDAEILPFYFLLSVPRNADEGVLLLQRFQNFGIRKILLKAFRDFFDANHDRFLVQINPMVQGQVLEKLRRARRLDSIRLVRYSLPRDVADTLRLPHDEVEVEYILSIKEKTSNVLNQFKSLFEGNFRLAELEELVPGMDTVKVDVELDDGKRRIDLSRPALRATYDISDSVAVERNGHPSFDSISRAARELLVSINRDLGRE